jgi:hypothetical protein
MEEADHFNGPAAVHKVLEANSQLKRRFAMRIELKNFSNSGHEEKQPSKEANAANNNFRTFLKTLDDGLPLAENSNLADALLAKGIYNATSGNIAHTMKLVRKRPLGSPFVRKRRRSPGNIWPWLLVTYPQKRWSRLPTHLRKNLGTYETVSASITLY